MKALFLLQSRAGQIPDYFQFKPYLYGPCSFEVYDVLAALEREGLVVRPLDPMPHWVAYYLTERGKKEAEKAVCDLDPKLMKCLEAVTREVSRLGFYELLKRVYDEAPEFAENSLLKGVLKR